MTQRNLKGLGGPSSCENHLIEHLVTTNEPKTAVEPAISSQTESYTTDVQGEESNVVCDTCTPWERDHIQGAKILLLVNCLLS